MTDKVYIIHNSDRIDRYRVLMNELREQGIDNYELMPALHDDNFAYIGISKAHKNVIQHAKNEGLESIIVAEDDLKFFGKGAFDYWMKRTPKEYDLWLGGVYLGVIEDGITSRFTGMSLYRCHSLFYDTFLEAEKYEQIDIALAHKGLYKVCEPMVVRQHNGYSDNEKRHMNYDFMFSERSIYKESVEYY